MISKRSAIVAGLALALLLPAWPAAGTTQGTWTIEPVSTGAGLGGVFESVSCPSATMCMAVGSGSFGDHGYDPLVARWNGAEWSAQAFPIPSRGGSFQLTSVSCPTTTTCVAVGWSYPSGAPPARPMFERWDATGWRPMPALSPPGGPGVDLWGVDCSGPDACVAVGSTYRNYTNWPLVERWDGHLWRPAATAESHLGTQGELYSVSCRRTGDCVAVGLDFMDEGPLAVRTDGSTFSIMDMRAPPGTRDSGLSSVSCAALNACVAVGYLQPSGTFEDLPLVERWDGSRWAIERVPVTRQQLAYLTGVSCSSREVCVAVGAADPSHGADALRWTGDLWRWETAEVPPGSIGEQFEAVSCVRSGACTAVGVWSQGYHGMPLAERSEA